MCGRFTLRRPQHIDARQLGVAELPPLEPRFNIAPSEDILLLRMRRGTREASLVRWGLVPSWAKDPSIGNRMVNARADSLTAKPSFRDAWARRRGLVLADGFYEWRSLPGTKRRQPWFVHMRDDRPFAFGAIWDTWRDRTGDGDWLVTCSLITTEPNAVVSELHDRMPVIVAPDEWARWLGEADEGAPPTDLLRPYPAKEMLAHAVSTRVNDPANDDQECIEPAEPEER